MLSVAFLYVAVVVSVGVAACCHLQYVWLRCRLCGTNMTFGGACVLPGSLLPVAVSVAAAAAVVVALIYWHWPVVLHFFLFLFLFSFSVSVFLATR